MSKFEMGDRVIVTTNENFASFFRKGDTGTIVGAPGVVCDGSGGAIDDSQIGVKFDHITDSCGDPPDAKWRRTGVGFPLIVNIAHHNDSRPEVKEAADYYFSLMAFSGGENE